MNQAHTPDLIYQRALGERRMLRARAADTSSDLRNTARQRLIEPTRDDWPRRRRDAATQREGEAAISAAQPDDGFFVWEVCTADDELGPVGVSDESIQAQSDAMTELQKAPAGSSATVWRVRLDPFGNCRYLYGHIVACGHRPRQVNGVLWDAHPRR